MIWLVAATQLLFDPLSAAIAAPISNSQGDKYPLYFLHHEFTTVIQQFKERQKFKFKF